MFSIAVASHTYPSRHSPAQVPFIKDEARLIAEDHHVELHIPAVYAFPFQKQFYRSYLPDEDKLTVHRFRYLSFPGRRFASITQKSLSKHLIKSLSYQKPDIVHLHWLYPAGMAAPAIKNEGIPVVLTIHGGDWYSNLSNQKIMPLLESVLKACDKIICVGKQLFDDIRDYDPQLESKLIHIPHGIDTERFYAASDKKREAQNLGWNSIKTNILCVANLYHEKGIDLLGEAYAAQSNREKLHLHIVAPESEKKARATVDRIIKEHSLTDEITFYEGMDHELLSRFFRAAGLLVSPSRKEGFGLVVAEAISSGTPVLATRSGGPEEIVNTESGMLVDANSSEKLAAGLEDIIKNLEKYDSEKMHRHIKTNFSISAKKEKLMAVYDDLVK